MVTEKWLGFVDMLKLNMSDIDFAVLDLLLATTNVHMKRPGLSLSLDECPSVIYCKCLVYGRRSDKASTNHRFIATCRQTNRNPQFVHS